MDSGTEWREDGRRVDVELGTSVSDPMEGGLRGSVRNGCQVGESGSLI